MSLNLDEVKVKRLVGEIKQKKELKDLADSFVREQLLKILKQEVRLLNSLSNKFHPKSRAFKLTIKLVRGKLRRMHGLFRAEENNIESLVKEYLNFPSKEKLVQILKSHSSTKERIDFYPQLYQKIFTITGEPKSILDLGCGINPFSVLFMGLEKINPESERLDQQEKLKELKYYAYDLNEEEINQLKMFFNHLRQKNKYFSGEAKILDFEKIEEIKKLPSADVAFFFKITDIIDQGKGHKKSEEVIKAIPAKFIVVSFPTLTMSGKRMNHPRRGWIELMCKRLGYEFKFLEFSNEIFYVLEKMAEKLCASLKGG